MKIEFMWHTLSDAKILSREWLREFWFELGISYQRTEFNSHFRKLFAISLAVFSIHIRW